MILFYQALYERFHELHGDIERALEGVPTEVLDWKPGADMNSVAVLITHLTGAERFLIGDVVMGDPSNRVRETEFQAEGLTKQDLLQRLTMTDAYIKGAFEKMSLADLETDRVHPRHGNKVSVAFSILHALEHAATHVGHIDLTVQLWKLPDFEG
ncbi:MAG: hypothetical protein A2Y88_08520 [Chloroflexi bacterium RBG_13_48_10]|nr:MAG: hypothetical protein A2Y88_08520 [Chloroflexi bacterium RBG_13_48_10]